MSCVPGRQAFLSPSGPRKHLPLHCRNCSRVPIAVSRSAARRRRKPVSASHHPMSLAAISPSISKPRSARLDNRRLFRYAGWLLAAVVVVIVGRNMSHDLLALRSHPLPHPPRWGLIILSGAIFLTGHAVL